MSECLEIKNKIQDVVYKKLTLNIDSEKLKVMGWRKVQHASMQQKKAITIIINKAHFKTSKIMKGLLKSSIVYDKGGDYLENIVILNVYASSVQH